MEKDRLLAFTEGVIAVIITIMVLEMKVPQDASLGALTSVIPIFLSYVLSFVYVAIYWNNHHHFFHLVCHPLLPLAPQIAAAAGGLAADHGTNRCLPCGSALDRQCSVRERCRKSLSSLHAYRVDTQGYN